MGWVVTFFKIEKNHQEVRYSDEVSRRFVCPSGGWPMLITFEPYARGKVQLSYGKCICPAPITGGVSGNFYFLRFFSEPQEWKHSLSGNK